MITDSIKIAVTKCLPGSCYGVRGSSRPDSFCSAVILSSTGRTSLTKCLVRGRVGVRVGVRIEDGAHVPDEVPC